MSKAESVHWEVYIPEQIEGKCSACKFAIISLESQHPNVEEGIDEFIEFNRSTGEPRIDIDICCRIGPIHSPTKVDNFCGGYVKGQPQVSFVAEMNGKGGTIEWKPTVEPLKIVEATP